MRALETKNGDELTSSWPHETGSANINIDHSRVYDLDWSFEMVLVSGKVSAYS